MNNFDNTKANIESVSEQTQQKLKEAQNQLQKSGNDWWDYIKDHPIQSMLFGISLLYSIKGFLSEIKEIKSP